MANISIELLLAYVGIGIAVFALIAGFGVAIGMDARTRGEYLFAITCFLVSALMIVAVICLWDVTTQSSFTGRGLISIFSIALVCFTLSEVIRWTGNRHEHAKERGVSGPPVPHLPQVPANALNKTPTERPKSPEIKPQQSPAKGQTPQTIVQTQAPYGNLARRCESLGDSIIRFVAHRNQIKPTVAPTKEYWEWYRVNDGQFLFHFHDEAKALQKDLAVVNIKDRQLDALMEKHEQYYADRNRQQPQFVFDRTPMFHMSIEELEEIGVRFKNLASQVPR